jgi:hypothetical protein
MQSDLGRGRALYPAFVAGFEVSRRTISHLLIYIPRLSKFKSITQFLQKITFENRYLRKLAERALYLEILKNPTQHDATADGSLKRPVVRPGPRPSQGKCASLVRKPGPLRRNCRHRSVPRFGKCLREEDEEAKTACPPETERSSPCS